MTRRMLGLLLVAGLAAGCRDVPLHPAEVTLDIDGEDLSYTTAVAQWEEEGGRRSVYLLRDSPGPYVNLRYYSGNPVGHFTMRRDDDGDGDAERYECFVPGVLTDGRNTLGWKKANGEDRHTNETGEVTCQASVATTADTVTVTFDAGVHKVEKKAKGDHGGGEGHEDEVELIQVSGTAILSR